MSASAHAADPGGRHWLSFRIGEQLYAAPLAEVSEVIRDGELTPVPGAADDLLGVRHQRARIVPVLEGRLRLGLSVVPPADPATVRIVMLSVAGQLIGVRVDAVGELLDTDGTDIAPPPSGRASRRADPVSGVLAWQGGFVALLDVPRLCRLSGEADHVA
jgi:purine-binding chemotaxis protein CheW